MAKQNTLAKMGIPFECWFWSNVDTLQGANDCWVWRNAKNPLIHVTISQNKKHLSAHRVAYELSKGEIPKGQFVCHSCDNPICCNPRHLWTGSHQDNMTDMSVKGRAGRKPVVTLDQYLSVRDQINNPNVIMADIAENLGVAISSVYRARHRYG